MELGDLTGTTKAPVKGCSTTSYVPLNFIFRTLVSAQIGRNEHLLARGSRFEPRLDLLPQHLPMTPKWVFLYESTLVEPIYPEKSTFWRNKHKRHAISIGLRRTNPPTQHLLFHKHGHELLKWSKSRNLSKNYVFSNAMPSMEAKGKEGNMIYLLIPYLPFCTHYRRQYDSLGRELVCRLPRAHTFPPGRCYTSACDWFRTFSRTYIAKKNQGMVVNLNNYINNCLFFYLLR